MDQFSRKQKFDSLKTTETIHTVRISNFVAVQESGTVTLALPELVDSVKFKVKYVESYANGDFFWYGNLEMPDTCVDLEEQDTSVCGHGSFTLLRKGSSYTGSIHLGDSLYYHIRDLGDSLSALILLNRDSFFLVPECAAPLNIPFVPDTTEANFSTSFCPVKILVLYTTAAIQQHPDILNIINMSILETKSILKNSEVFPNQLELILAGTAEITSDVWVETPIITDDVNNAIANTQMQDLRTLYKADLVVVLTRDNIHLEAVGAVTSFGDFQSAKDSAFAVIETGACLGPWYSFTHEIGHLFGCRHERKPQDCASIGDNSGLPDAHGFIINKKGFLFFGDKDVYNTIMAVCNRGADQPGNIGAGVRGHSRIAYFSNPNVKWSNRRTGAHGTNNNAKILRNAACRIANYVVSEDPGLYLEFPEKACPELLALGTVTITGNIPQPWQCTWQHSYDGFTWSAPTVNACTGHSAVMPPNPGERLYIRVEGGNINGPMLTKHTDVLADNTTINCPRESYGFSESPFDTPHAKISVFPNPATDELTVKYSSGFNSDESVKVFIFSLEGRPVFDYKFFPDDSGGSELFKIQSLPSGAYVLLVQTSNSTFRNNLIIIK